METLLRHGTTPQETTVHALFLEQHAKLIRIYVPFWNCFCERNVDLIEKGEQVKSESCDQLRRFAKVRTFPTSQKSADRNIKLPASFLFSCSCVRIFLVLSSNPFPTCIFLSNIDKLTPRMSYWEFPVRVPCSKREE